MVDLFLEIILTMILFMYLLGELWIHKKAGIFFPRYFVKKIRYKEVGKTYILNNNEQQILVRLGRQIVISTLCLLWVFLLLITISNRIVINHGIVGMIILFFIILYHYHASFRD